MADYDSMTREELIKELEELKDEFAGYKRKHEGFIFNQQVYQQLTEKGDIIFYELDYRTNSYLSLSNNAERILGISLERFNRHELVKRIVTLDFDNPQPDLPKNHEEFEEAFLEKEVDFYQNEFKFKKDNGEFVWLSDYSIPIRDQETDEVIRSLGIMIDITWRKQIIENLHKKSSELTITNHKLERARNALWGEMMLAKKIQIGLLPENPAIPGYLVTGFMKPAEEVGGDYYDVINTAKDNWVAIGDVSGHGVSAGLIMMMVQTSINTLVANNPGITPADILAAVNKTIYQNIVRLNEEKYMSLTIMDIAPDGTLTFSGMHQDILVYRSATQTVEIVQTNGLWIGIVDDISKTLHNQTFTIEKNDVVLLYTDGITEARIINTNELTFFGLERLEYILRENGEKTPDEIKEVVLSSLKGYFYDDDITLLILKKV